MKVVIIASVLVAFTVGIPREKRQLDGSFWWETTASPTAATTTQSNGRADTDDEIRIVNHGTPAPQRSCICVPYYQCTDEGKINTDGAGILDIRLGPSRSNTTRSSLPACERILDVCCENPSDINIITEVPKYTAQCGRLNSGGINTRITGFKDNEAQFGEFPWMTAVLKTERIGGVDTNLYVCGGSLIQPGVVLTAAHCVAGKAPGILKVRLGEWDTQHDYELSKHEDKVVRSAVIHPEYNSGNLWNDFALLFLESPYTLQSHIDTVCLPDSNTIIREGTRCFASGWGKDKFGDDGVFQNILKKINVPVVGHQKCQNKLRSTRLGNFFSLDTSFMCAGGEPNKDTCKGDGGSPLVCSYPNNPNKYFQAGIVAWGIGCGENGVPGVYANIVYASDWIKNELRQRLR